MPIFETIDRFGLKARFLSKHKRYVKQFYNKLSRTDYQSDLAIKYQNRFQKGRNTLFTFLSYDDVPWNNNNAEHAIKSFALLRNAIGASSNTDGIIEYLILLSIYETCRNKGVIFLDFLLSGEKNIESFVKSKP